MNASWSMSWFAVVVVLVQFTAPAQASLDVPERSKDFGAAPRGTLLRYTFPITNNYPSALHFSHLRTSCGVCTQAQIAKDWLQPGEKTTLNVTVNTANFSGLRTFTVYVTLDQPVLQELQFSLIATSREDLSVNPESLAFGRVKHASQPNGSLQITHYGSQTWQIVGVDNDNGYIQPKIEQIERQLGKTVYRLNVSLRGDTPVGAWHAEVYLRTNDPSTPRIRIPISVEIVGSLSAQPTELVFGEVAVADSRERKVVIRGEKPFKVTKIEGLDDTLKVGELSTEAKKVHVLTFTMTGSKAGGEVNRKLKVLTDLGAEASLELTAQARLLR